MDNTKHIGFTLVELLIALAVAAILLGVGIPSFSGAIKNSQVSSDYNGLVQALYLSRSEAVKTSQEVTLCPKKDVDTQICGDNATDWKNGWLVFVDNRPAAAHPGHAEIGIEDEIISIHAEPRSKNIIKSYESDDGSKTGVKDRTFIQYGGAGLANWENGTFELCNNEEDRLSRAINIAPTGDVRPGRPSGSEKPRNIYSDEVECL